MTTIILFQLVVLILSIMVHEVAHGAMALRLGDDTAQRLGRLTFNPLRHIDPIGSVFLPLFLVLIGSPFLIGWAKPVPYDPRRLRNPRSGAALIAAAGPLSNIAISVFFGLILYTPLLTPAFVSLAVMIIYLNLFLAVFNLVPIPPLDGSKILYYILPDRSAHIQFWLEQYGPFLLLLFIFAGGIRVLFPIIEGLFRIITGGAL